MELGWRGEPEIVGGWRAGKPFFSSGAMNRVFLRVGSVSSEVRGGATPCPTGAINRAATTVGGSSIVGGS